MNNVEMGLIKWVLKRIMSRSPEFYVRIRIAAAMIMFILAALTWLINQHILPIAPNMISEISSLTTTLTKIFAGVFGASWLGTTDPSLMSPSSKSAVVDEATQDKNKGNNPTT